MKAVVKTVEPADREARFDHIRPHYLEALTLVERLHRRLLDVMRAFARCNGTIERLVGKVALPLCEAVLAHGQGRHGDVLKEMRPIVGDLYLLGGSHAQQDILEQLFLDSALKADSGEDVRLMLERVSGRYPVPPARRVGYAAAASGFTH